MEIHEAVAKVLRAEGFKRNSRGVFHKNGVAFRQEDGWPTLELTRSGRGVAEARGLWRPVPGESPSRRRSAKRIWQIPPSVLPGINGALDDGEGEPAEVLRSVLDWGLAMVDGSIP